MLPLHSAGPGEHPVHPLRGKARVLLTSVFGPYAQDDEYGSRRINPMELYHNQVTRLQGPFSLRMFHRSWGLMLIKANISAPCTLLDFPSQARFIEELRTRSYDVIGIGAIIPNLGKVKRMCELIREHQPHATIIVGGHVASKPELDGLVDADFIVRGEGVAWMRSFLGEDPTLPLAHPYIQSGFGARTMGLSLPTGEGETAATVIPSVGCPLGCNFCSTSALFGGKGKSVLFFPTGDELFEVMSQLERAQKTSAFFVMDENFLIHKERSLRLLELMRQHGKAWSLYVFSSANALRKYTMEQLLGLGISWVWMGLEGDSSQYAKLDHTDTFALVRGLQANGIRVLGSSIIGLEEHSLENIDAVIDHAVRHDTEFHQFMLYTPMPGTPLYREHQAAGTLLPESECGDADAHGQDRFKHRHPSIPAGQENGLLLRAFQRDLDVNGPSVVRVIRTGLRGWKAHKHHPDLRVRARVAREAKGLSTTSAGVLWAARAWFARTNPAVAKKIGALLDELCAEFGLRTRLFAAALGPVILYRVWREDRRLARGACDEPATFYEPGPIQATRPAVRDAGKLAA